jgi:hypothetical protein
MKNSHILIYAVAIALLAFTACGERVKEDNVSGEEEKGEKISGVAIRFTDREAPNGMLRSAGDLSKANLNAMTVYAHYTGADDFAAAADTSAPNFMLNQLVTKDNGAWTYTPLKYWPSQHRKVSFFAVAPAPAPAANGIELVERDGSYTGYPSFTVTPPPAPAQQQDICVASALSCTDTTNDGKVPLLFAHAMAKVKFSARYISESTHSIVMKQLKFAGIYSSNTLRFTASGFEWGSMATAKSDYTLSAADNTLVGTPMMRKGDAGDSTISTEAGTLLLVPQAVFGAKLEATFWVGDKAIVREADLPPLVWTAGNLYTYSLSSVLMVWDYSCTGAPQTFSAPEDGSYILEAWGASGSTYEGKGGYVVGEIYLKKGTNIYVYVGQSAAGFNGGGAGVGGGRGGGATDFRLLDGAWNLAKSLNSRILVAGGGGGGYYSKGHTGRGGAAGGLTGFNGSKAGPDDTNRNRATAGLGGGQTSGGSGVSNGYSTAAGSFGQGSAGNSNGNVGGGGSGYYGGSGAARASGWNVVASGGGGSSFISGMNGCIAIDPASTTNPRAQKTEGNISTLSYSSSVFSTSPTWNDGDEVIFTKCSMVDGGGYEWNTGVRAGTVGTMPNPAGGAMTGNTGDGYARITFLQ